MRSLLLISAFVFQLLGLTAQQVDQQVFRQICDGLLAKDKMWQLNTRFREIYTVVDPVTLKTEMIIPDHLDKKLISEFGRYSPAMQRQIINADSLSILPLTDTVYIMADSLFNTPYTYTSNGHTFIASLDDSSEQNGSTKKNMQYFKSEQEDSQLTIGFLLRAKFYISYYLNYYFSSIDNTYKIDSVKHYSYDCRHFENCRNYNDLYEVPGLLEGVCDGLLQLERSADTCWMFPLTDTVYILRLVSTGQDTIITKGEHAFVFTDSYGTLITTRGRSLFTYNMLNYGSNEIMLDLYKDREHRLYFYYNIIGDVLEFYRVDCKQY